MHERRSGGVRPENGRGKPLRYDQAGEWDRAVAFCRVKFERGTLIDHTGDIPLVTASRGQLS